MYTSFFGVHVWVCQECYMTSELFQGLDCLKDYVGILHSPGEMFVVPVNFLPPDMLRPFVQMVLL